ncbi:MAG: hypothetical protein AB1486_13860 [Planctomycetota bacterium]
MGRRRTMIAVSSACGLAIVLVAWWVTRQVAGPEASLHGEGHAVAAGDAEPRDEKALSEESVSRLLLAGNPPPGAESEAAELPEEVPPTGWLELVPVDAVTGRIVRQACVRLMSEKRFGIAGAWHSVRWVLTAGRYDAWIDAAGYEPMAAGPFEVLPGRVTDAGCVKLTRGLGAIEGRLITAESRKERSLFVELYGQGRGPCERCGRNRRQVKSCESCGYSQEKSVVATLAGERFRFETLASGSYCLVAREAMHPHIVTHHMISLEVGEQECVEISLPEPATVTFELRDEGGRPLLPEQHGHTFVVYTFREGGSPIGQVIQRFEVDDPRKTELEEYVTEVVIEDVLESHFSADPRIDWARRPGETLIYRAAAAAPSRPFANLVLEVLTPWQHRISPLPRAELTVEVLAGRYASGETELDLRECVERSQHLVMKEVLAPGETPSIERLQHSGR